MRRITCDQCAIRYGSCIIQDVSDDRLDEFQVCGASGIYKARQVVFHEGTPADGLYLLCHGAVKLYQADRFGREHILAIATPGDILGELPLAPGETYSASAEAITDSQLRYLPEERLIAFIQMHPMTGVRLIASLSKALAASHAKAGDLALNRAEVRLAKLLVNLAHSGGEARNGSTHIALSYSRREIAEMIGVSTETAIRLLGRLKGRKLLNAHMRELVITDLERLTRLAQHGSTAADGRGAGARGHGAR
jgi:CRP-like cAMP-binding protein